MLDCGSDKVRPGRLAKQGHSGLERPGGCLGHIEGHRILDIESIEVTGITGLERHMCTRHVWLHRE